MSNRWNDSFSLGLLERGDCRDEAAQAAISSYLDGEADVEERRLAEYHLSSCHACQSMALNWRQAGRMIGSTVFTEGPTFQIQAELRQDLRAFLKKEAARPARRPVSGVALTGGVLAVCAFMACAFLLTHMGGLGGTTLLDTSTASLAITANPVTTRANATFAFSPMRSNPLAPTPTVAVSSLNLSSSLNANLKGATAFRAFPAPEGRFAGWLAVVAWYGDKSNRLWIVNPQQAESEVSLVNLTEAGEAVRFYYDDPQAVIWSERGALVSYHLSNVQINEWGLVVPQSGQVSAARLVQPPTAIAMARATTTALAGTGKN